MQSPSPSNTAAGLGELFLAFPKHNRGLPLRADCCSEDKYSERSVRCVSPLRPLSKSCALCRWFSLRGGSGHPCPKPGACWSPVNQQLMQHIPTSQHTSTWAGRRMPHKRVMTTPTQLWHNTLQAPAWQPKRASDDCDFPLKERWARTSPYHRVSPLSLLPLSHWEKCILTETCPIFKREMFQILLVEMESQQIQLLYDSHGTG